MNRRRKEKKIEWKGSKGVMRKRMCQEGILWVEYLMFDNLMFDQTFNIIRGENGEEEVMRGTVRVEEEEKR